MVEIDVTPDGNPRFTYNMYRIDKEDVDIILKRFFAHEGSIFIILYFSKSRQDAYEYCHDQCRNLFGPLVKNLCDDYDPINNCYSILIEKEERSAVIE